MITIRMIQRIDISVSFRRVATGQRANGDSGHGLTARVLLPVLLHRRGARRMQRVVRDVVHRPHDPVLRARPRPLVTDVEHVDARGRLLEAAEVGAAAGQRVREDDPVDAAVEDREQRVPVAGQQPLERRQDAVEQLAERLAAEEARRLVVGPERADERPLPLRLRDVAQPAAAPLRELGPGLDLARGRDDRGGLDRARQAARDDAVEGDAGERSPRGLGLLAAGGGERDLLRVDRACRRRSKYETSACRSR